MRRRGFSLTEVLVCLGVLALLAGMLPLLRRNAPGKAGTRGAAEALAQTLRTAQARAVLKQVPVAVGIPTQGGQRPLSRHFYLLEGFSSPRVTELNSLEEYGPIYVSCPTWAGETFVTDTSAQGLPGFDLTQWAAPYPQDYLVIFMPPGNVVTNGLPRTSTGFHLVIGQGLSLQGGSIDNAPPAYVLTGAAQTCTIHLTPLGQVRVDSGVPGAQLIQTEAGGEAAAAIPPSLAPLPTRSPTIANVLIAPNGKDMTLPPGVQAMLQRDQFLTLTVQANSPESVPLYCNWTADGGRFSHPIEKPMVWDRSLRLWVSTWQWEPDPVGTKVDYHANCTVRDAWGHQAPAVVNSQILLQVQPRKQKVLAVASLGSGLELCTAYADGTGQKKITDRSPLKDSNSSISPDGTKIAGLSKVGGLDVILVRDVEGGILQQITGIGSADPLSPPVWSPDGVHLAYAANGDIWICTTDGATRTNLTNTPGVVESLSVYNAGDPVCLDDAVWSPDSLRLVFHKNLPSSDNYLCSIGVDGTGLKQLTPAGQVRHVSWSPNGDQLAFDDIGRGIFLTKADGSNAASPQQIGSTSDDLDPHFSPDAQTICYTEYFLGPLKTVTLAQPTTPVQVPIQGQGDQKAFGPVWVDDVTISYMRGNGGSSARIVTIPVTGGKPDLILPVETSGGNNIHIAGWTK